jgi:hypothetical protein
VDKAAVVLLLEVAEYLLRQHEHVMELERSSSDQAGEWDERDDLLEDLNEVRTLIERISRMRAVISSMT